MADTGFLAEVEEFLTSCDLSTPVPIEDDRKHKTTERSPKNSSTEDCCSYTEDTDRKSYYRRRQMERMRLRRQVVELAEELNKRRRASEAIKLQVPSKWRAIAKYHEQERFKAEDKHRRLCRAINTRAATIAAFRELMHVRLDAMGRVSEEEAQLIKCEPVTHPTDTEMPQCHMSELVLDAGFGCEIRSASTYEVEEEVWRDSGQIAAWISQIQYSFRSPPKAIARLIHTIRTLA